MATRLGWSECFAPIVAANAVIGTVRPDLAARTGLPADAQVVAGLHDSNAALLAARGFREMAACETTVLSTGTWFIAMRQLTDPITQIGLAEARDCLVNVDTFGRPVPSARFMGGREIERLIELDSQRIDIEHDQPALLAQVRRVLRDGSMVLPTLTPGCGPFPSQTGRWVNRPDNSNARRTAASLYAALVSDSMLDLIGSSERLLVEGRFARAEVFVRALASLRPEMEIYCSNAHNDASFGALRLVAPDLFQQGKLTPVEALDANLETYSSRWLGEIGNVQ
jgi:sugar (pentulose or hexulose) kinase